MSNRTFRIIVIILSLLPYCGTFLWNNFHRYHTMLLHWLGVEEGVFWITQFICWFVLASIYGGRKIDEEREKEAAAAKAAGEEKRLAIEAALKRIREGTAP